MVAVLRAEIEQFDEDHNDSVRDRHLRIVDLVTEGPVSVRQTTTRRDPSYLLETPHRLHGPTAGAVMGNVECCWVC